MAAALSIVTSSSGKEILKFKNKTVSVSPSRSVAESTETPRAIDVHQRPRRSTRNLEDSSSRRSSRQSTSNAPAVSLVRSGAQFARPSLNLPHGYGKLIRSVETQVSA